MPDIDLATILADGEYLRRVGDTLDGGTPGGTAEDAVDAVATALVAGNNIDVTYNDVAGTITVAVEDDVVDSTTVNTLWTGTQAAYDAIGTKDSSTLYFIT